jgi:hypothetical protein
MSLEQVIQANTDAINALIATLKGGVPAAGAAATETTATTTDKPKRGRPSAADKAKEADQPKNNAETVKAAAVRVKDTLGTKAAKELIKKHGAEELAKLKPEAYDAFVADAEEMLKPEEPAGDDDDNDDDVL